MANIWIVVAESSRAKIFMTDSPVGALQDVEMLEHPEARQREQYLTSDRPGRSFDSAGEGRHAMGQPVSPKEEEAIRFAKQIADRIEAARVKGAFERLILVAPPHFLGLLRQQLSSHIMALVSKEIHKNLVQHEPNDIRRHLPERL